MMISVSLCVSLMSRSVPSLKESKCPYPVVGWRKPPLTIANCYHLVPNYPAVLAS